MIRRIKEKFGLLCAYWISAAILYSGYIVEELPNPDAVWNSVLYKSSYKWELQLGRFMIPVFQKILGSAISTSFVTLLFILILGVSCLYIVDILEIEKKAYRYVAGMMIIISPNVQSMISYYYCSVGYIIAFLMACTAVMLLISGYDDRRKKIKGLISAMILICLSIGTYQAYIGFVITIGVIYAALGILKKKDWMQLRRKAIMYIVGVGGGTGLYLIVNKVMLAFFHTENTSDRGFSEMGRLDIANLPNRLYMYCIHYYKEYFIGNDLLNNDYGFIPRKYINLVFIVCTAGLFVYLIMAKEISIVRKIITVIMTMLIPIASMSIFILAPEIDIHEATGVLMLPTVNMVYVFAVALADMIIIKKEHIFRELFVFICGMVMLMYMQMALDGQSYMKYMMNKTDTVANEIVSKITDISGWNTKKVCMAGCVEDGNYPNDYPELKSSVEWLPQSRGTLWTGYDPIQNGYRQYIRDHGGIKYSTAEECVYESIKNTDEFKQMPIFPSEGSTKEINGIIVVKLSDE